MEEEGGTQNTETTMPDPLLDREANQIQEKTAEEQERQVKDISSLQARKKRIVCVVSQNTSLQGSEAIFHIDANEWIWICYD